MQQGLCDIRPEEIEILQNPDGSGGCFACDPDQLLGGMKASWHVYVLHDTACFLHQLAPSARVVLSLLADPAPHADVCLGSGGYGQVFKVAVASSCRSTDGIACTKHAFRRTVKGL